MHQLDGAEGRRVPDERILILTGGPPGRADAQAMRVPRGSERTGVRVRAHAHHSSRPVRASCTASPTNQLGTVCATVSSGVR